MSCPQKHLIKLVFEGNYLDEAIKQKTEGSSTVTFYADIVKADPSDNKNKHITDCRIDSIYGENQWKVLEFNGSLNPVKIQHKCGEIKTLTRASTVKKGVTLCDICKHEKI